MINFVAVKCDFTEGLLCFYEMRLKRLHSSIKYETCSRHLSVLTSLFLLFFIVWVLFICGIGEAIVKINCHHLWVAGYFVFFMQISQSVPQDTYSFLQKNALLSLHPSTSRPSTTSFTSPLLIAQTFLLEILLVLQSVFHLTWLSITLPTVLSWVFPVALSTTPYR